MGKFELPGFAAGTQAVARAMGQATAAGATTVVGGVCQFQPQSASCKPQSCWEITGVVVASLWLLVQLLAGLVISHGLANWEPCIHLSVQLQNRI